jgi:hypothetical protein
VTWSRSGEWLYDATAGRRIAAHRPADGRTVDEAISIAALD